MSDLLEKFKALHNAHSWMFNLSPEETQFAFAHWGEFSRQKQAENFARDLQLTALYRSLSSEDGRKLALAAIELFDSEVKPKDYLPERILTRLAGSVPGSLVGLHALLLDRNLFWEQGILFRESDAHIRDQLLNIIEGGIEDKLLLTNILCALAWIGDETVQRRFKHWRSAVPLGNYTRVAGWEVTNEGLRRDLFYQECYELIPTEKVSGGDIPGPVTVVAPHGERCGGCGRHLFTIFDLNLTDSRLNFFKLKGRRLRIAACPTCLSVGDLLFTNVDLDGASQWSEVNGERIEPLDDLDDWEDFPELPQGRLVLGQARRTPYETYGAYGEKVLSQIGGHPKWVQDAGYPKCPVCMQRMTFIGQLERTDILAGEEGIIYAFLCVDCGLAATRYQ